MSWFKIWRISWVISPQVTGVCGIKTSRVLRLRHYYYLFKVLSVKSSCTLDQKLRKDLPESRNPILGAAPHAQRHSGCANFSENRLLRKEKSRVAQTSTFFNDFSFFMWFRSKCNWLNIRNFEKTSELVQIYSWVLSYTHSTTLDVSVILKIDFWRKTSQNISDFDFLKIFLLFLIEHSLKNSSRSQEWKLRNDLTSETAQIRAQV